MQKITVVGADSAAKTAVIIALNSTFEVTNLLPEEVNFNNIGETDLVIYVTELQPDRKLFERLRKGYRGLILISKAKLMTCDLFLSVVNFQSFPAKGVFKEIQLLRDFIIRFFSNREGLSDIQRSVISQLSKSSSEEEALSTLSISRRTYYVILAELRSLYGVSKNWQLIQIIQNTEQVRTG
jgi:hypothetical protein